MTLLKEMCDQGRGVLEEGLERRSKAQATRYYDLEAVMVGLKFKQGVWH